MSCKSSLGVALLAVLAFVGPVRSQDREPRVSDLEGLVRQLLELRRAAEEEKNLSRERCAHLETTLALYERERAVLSERLEELEKRREASGEERSKLEAGLAGDLQVLRDVDGAVSTAAERIRTLCASLPPSLVDPLAGGLSRLDARAPGDDPVRVTERLRLLNALSAEVDRVLGTAHSVKEVLEGDGADGREVDVLYLGGAVGYWVAQDDRSAGLLLRRAGEARILRRDDLAPAIRHALAVVEKERPPELVRLPLAGEETK
jgi:hypothetical protein